MVFLHEVFCLGVSGTGGFLRDSGENPAQSVSLGENKTSTKHRNKETQTLGKFVSERVPVFPK